MFLIGMIGMWGICIVWLAIVRLSMMDIVTAVVVVMIPRGGIGRYSSLTEVVQLQIVLFPRYGVFEAFVRFCFG